MYFIDFIFNSHSFISLSVLPKIQANQSNAADALMLDIDGFVSETNATNVFMIKDGKVSTPSADYCLPGEMLDV